MTGSWRVPATEVVGLLEKLGLTITMGADPPGRDLTATGDWATTHVAVAIDATGRVRVTRTTVSDDTAAEPIFAGGRRFAQVRTRHDERTVTGDVGSAAELRALLAAVGLVDHGR